MRQVAQFVDLMRWCSDVVSTLLHVRSREDGARLLSTAGQIFARCLALLAAVIVSVVCQERGHRCNFSSRFRGWEQRAKNAQGTIKILMESDFSSNLTHLLSKLGGSAHHWGRTQPTLEGLGARPKRYEVTPLSEGCICPFIDVLPRRRSSAN